MAITFANLRTIAQGALGDSSNSTFVDQCLNHAQREVARAHRWPELMVRAFFNTEAAYETGTVAVANAGTTWTLTGGTFPTTVATYKHRIAKSVSDPWYEITTRTDATHVETDAYQQDTETASSYIVYRSHYSLASAVDRVEEIWLHEEGHAVPLINAATDEQVTEFSHYPTGTGTPTHFYMMERDASGNKQILLGPDTPDDVFRVEYVYRKETTDDTYSLDESRWPVVLARALALAYAPKHYERSVAEQAKYKRLLAEEWGNESEVETPYIRVGQTRVAYPRVGRWPEHLMGYGTVEDPD